METSTEASDALITLLAFLGCAAFAYLALLILPFVSGWRALAKDYPDSEQNTLSGDSYSFQTLLLSFFSGFRNSMNITVKPNGLEMRPLFPFSVTCRRVFIPWKEVRKVTPKRALGQSQVEIVLKNRKFSIVGKAAKVIRKR